MGAKAARRTRTPRNLSSGCTNSKKKEKFCEKRTPTGVSPLLDLHKHSPELKKRLQRPTICILGSDSTPLGLFPKVTQLCCPHSKQMTPKTRREIDGRLSITQAQTPTGITIQFMNIYQFTASNPTGQTNIWTTTESWISKQKNNRIIMQGDLNCAHPGSR